MPCPSFDEGKIQSKNSRGQCQHSGKRHISTTSLFPEGAENVENMIERSFRHSYLDCSRKVTTIRLDAIVL